MDVSVAHKSDHAMSMTPILTVTLIINKTLYEL